MNKYNIAEHKDEIITGIIKNIIWLPIAGAIPFTVTLIKELYNNFYNETNSNITNILIIICLILSTLSITLNITLRFKNKVKEKSTTQIDETKDEITFKCKCETIIAEMIFSDRENIVSTIEHRMTVLAETVSEINKQLIWTGSNYNGTKIVQSNGDYTLIDSERKQSPYPYRIVFNQPKLRGDYIHFKTETSVTDSNHSMTPLYAFTNKYQTDKLILRVIVPKGMITNVTKSVYGDLSKDICIEPPTPIPAEEVGNVIRYTFEIDNPLLLYEYFIDWQFTN